MIIKILLWITVKYVSQYLQGRYEENITKEGNILARMASEIFNF